MPLKIAKGGDSGCVVEEIQRMSSVSDLSSGTWNRFPVVPRPHGPPSVE